MNDKKYFYAVQQDRTDDWDNGSCDWNEAVEMLRRIYPDHPDALIAKIHDCDDPFCEAEYPAADIL